MSEFAIDMVTGIDGFTYAVENTSETYTVTFSGAGSRFNRISTTPANFTWSVTLGTKISLGSNTGAASSFTIGDMANPTGTLVSVIIHNVRCAFEDGYNDHVGAGGGYGLTHQKVVFSVDTYDGNTALCLPVDTEITMADGTIREIGDLEDGDVLRGYSLNELGEDSDDNYMDWKVDELIGTPADVVVRNVVFSFSDILYNLNDFEIVATAEHPLLIKDITDNSYKFKPISLINVGDFLIKEVNGTLEEIEVETIEIENETNEIVSLDVETQDTYISNGYISHNKGGNTHTDLPAPGPPTEIGRASCRERV